MSLAVLSIDGSISQYNSCFFKKKLEGGLFKFYLREIQPRQVRCLWDRYTHSGHMLSYKIDQKIPVASQITTQFRQPFVTLTGERSLRGTQSQAGYMYP